MPTTVTPCPASSGRPTPPSFWEAFRYWFRLGFISFGGPAGQIAIMHNELVEKRRWISERRFLHALNYCMVLPGPEAQQLAIYMGWLLHRTWGGVVAGVLFVLPSLFMLSALTYVYLAFGDFTAVQGVFNGIKPAVVAIVVFAAWRIGSRALKHPLLWTLASGAFVAIFVLGVPFPYIVLGAGTIGFFAARFLPDAFAHGAGHGSDPAHGGRALIDDDTPSPVHGQFRMRNLVLLLAISVLIGASVMALLTDATLRDMGAFFTKAALVTFGGAYAVLPYVYQGGVEQHAWLTAPQMIDGLALGETTPGPLIMVVAFVGFVGGWTHQIFGPDALVWAGVAGAVVATFFTFLPSFIFVLAGAPLVEATHGNLKFTAPLMAITAAVVGVILHLAIFLGWHVLWPEADGVAPFSGRFEWVYAVMALAAWLALWRFKQDILRVITVSALIGLTHTYAGG